MKRLFPLLGGCFLPAVALASQEQHAAEGHGAAHGVPWATLLFSLINFLLFVGVLKKFAWPAIRNAVRERRQVVLKEIEEATRARREAEKLKAEWEQRLARLGEELDQMRRQSRAELDREREQLLAAAQKVAESIRRDAERAAEQEVRNARAMLREEVARQALEVARELAAQRLSPASQEKFVSDFLGRMPA